MLLASVTTERDEMKVTGILIASQRLGHGYILIPHLKSEMRGTLAPSFFRSDLGHPTSGATKDLELWSIYAGIPARKIKDREGIA
jgi:hypothetical protein